MNKNYPSHHPITLASPDKIHFSNSPSQPSPKPTIPYERKNKEEGENTIVWLR